MKWPLALLALIALTAVAARCQVLVSMELMSSKGSAPLVGRGIAAYTWNLHFVQIGPQGVPFDLVRFNFPEVRLYSLEQTNAILAARVAHSLPAEIAKWGGRIGTGGGVVIQAEAALKKSPSQLGNVISASGLIAQGIVAWAEKDTPKYAISNPVPQKIDLGVGNCADYSALAVFGKAATVVGPRRVDPIQTGGKP